jgi:hypothetical protein
MVTRLVKRPRIDPQSVSKDPLGRLRQNDRRTPVMPVSFAAALNAYMGEQRRSNRSRLQRVRNAWVLAVESVPGVNPNAARADVRAVAKTGAIVVTVDNPALAHELGVVYREPLLARLRELLQGRDSISGLQVKTHTRRRKM